MKVVTTQDWNVITGTGRTQTGLKGTMAYQSTLSGERKGNPHVALFLLSV